MSFLDFDGSENVQRYITRLDQVAVDYECRWGVGMLEKLVSPQTAEKWKRQQNKINGAIKDNNLNDIIGLVEGSIRGYAALENEAIALGYKPKQSDIWEVKHPDSGEIFRIVKNNIDYDGALGDGAHVFTLQEVARILDNHATIKEVKNAFPGSKVNKIYKNEDFNGDIPF